MILVSWALYLAPLSEPPIRHDTLTPDTIDDRLISEPPSARPNRVFAIQNSCNDERHQTVGQNATQGVLPRADARGTRSNRWTCVPARAYKGTSPCRCRAPLALQPLIGDEENRNGTRAGWLILEAHAVGSIRRNRPWTASRRNRGHLPLRSCVGLFIRSRRRATHRLRSQDPRGPRGDPLH